MKRGIHSMSSVTRLLSIFLCCAAADIFALNAKVVATQQSIQAFCGTRNVKIIFENATSAGTTLHYIDFNQGSTIRTIAGITNATYPVISSNGQKIAYASGSNGPIDDGAGNSVSGSARYCSLSETPAASVKIADTALVPRFVKNGTGDTLVYSTCRSTAMPWNGCGRTAKRSIDGSSAGSEIAVLGQGSYYGGLSYDNRYLAGGYLGGPFAVMQDLLNANGAVTVSKMRVQKNVTNIDTVIVSSGCNPSISSSRIFTNSMLYMDFGSAFFTSLNCHSAFGVWGFHQKIRINRIDGELLRIYSLPSDIPVNANQAGGDIISQIEWDGSEWTNHPYFAVASIRALRIYPSTDGQTNNNEFIYLINLKDSSYLPIAQTTDSSEISLTNLTHPYAWIEMPATFTEDSCWLKYSALERLADPAKRCSNASVHLFREGIRENASFVIVGHTLIASTPLSDVMVYNFSGAHTRVSVLGQSLSVVLPKVASGVYFVKCRTVQGSVLTTRWNVLKLF